MTVSFWSDYAERFGLGDGSVVRPGCAPATLLAERAAPEGVVLVHGLTDSPHFMTAIAEELHAELGYDVFLPLLSGHGLREPKGMEGVSVDDWKANVEYAVGRARQRCARVSIGGLSAGGGLATHAAITDRRINGALFLYSAALGLPGGPSDFLGNLVERALRTFLADMLDRSESLIGPSPYRYARVDLDAARQLSKLIDELDDLIDSDLALEPLDLPVFVAHSEVDTAVSKARIQDLQAVTRRAFEWFEISGSDDVAHASVVLRDAVFAHDAAPDDPPLEAANPRFGEMMEAAKRFARRHAQTRRG